MKEHTNTPPSIEQQPKQLGAVDNLRNTPDTMGHPDAQQAEHVQAQDRTSNIFKRAYEKLRGTERHIATIEDPAHTKKSSEILAMSKTWAVTGALGFALASANATTGLFASKIVDSAANTTKTSANANTLNLAAEEAALTGNPASNTNQAVSFIKSYDNGKHTSQILSWKSGNTTESAVRPSFGKDYTVDPNTQDGNHRMETDAMAPYEAINNGGPTSLQEVDYTLYTNVTDLYSTEAALYDMTFPDGKSVGELNQKYFTVKSDSLAAVNQAVANATPMYGQNPSTMSKAEQTSEVEAANAAATKYTEEAEVVVNVVDNLRENDIQSGTATKTWEPEDESVVTNGERSQIVNGTETGELDSFGVDNKVGCLAMNELVFDFGTTGIGVNADLRVGVRSFTCATPPVVTPPHSSTPPTPHTYVPPTPPTTPPPKIGPKQSSTPAGTPEQHVGADSPSGPEPTVTTNPSSSSSSSSSETSGSSTSGSTVTPANGNTSTGNNATGGFTPSDN